MMAEPTQPGRDQTPEEPALPRPVSNPEAVEKYARLPAGFFYYLGAFAEGILFLMFLLGRSPPERYAALAAMLVVLVLLLYFHDRFNRRAAEAERAQASAVPPAMVRDPVPEQPGPGIVTAPDGTFIYAKPPPNWQVTTPTLLEQASHEMNQQLLGPIDPDTTLPFRPGRLVCFTETSPTRIEYVPGRSMANGRPAVGGMFDEAVADSVVMFSASKFGATIRDMTPDHIFANLLSSLIMAGSLIEDVRETDAEVAGRRTLGARATKRLAHVLVNGQETDELVADFRLYVVEHENYIYVIQTRLLDGGPQTELHRRQIEGIVGSFAVTSAADAAERELAEKAAAKAEFDRIWTASTWPVLVRKGVELMRSMRSSDGVIRVSAEQLEMVRTLEAYVDAFPAYLPEGADERLRALSRHTQAAYDGDSAALAAFIAETEAAHQVQPAGPQAQGQEDPPPPPAAEP